jgi:hypothetical protein
VAERPGSNPARYHDIRQQRELLPPIAGTSIPMRAVRLTHPITVKSSRLSLPILPYKTSPICSARPYDERAAAGLPLNTAIEQRARDAAQRLHLGD